MSDGADRGLGEALVELGLVGEADLERARRVLVERRESGEPAALGQVLQELGLATAAQLEAASAMTGTLSAGPLPDLGGRGVTVQLEMMNRQELEEGFVRYLDLVEHARGGMGAIYRATDRDLGREVALKILLAHDYADRQQLRRFVREAQITGQLEHPNIVPIYGLGQTGDGRIYISMKLVKGRSLAQVLGDLRAAANPYRTRVELLNAFLKICDAIAFAHSRGVIHRDLKPANIMIGEFGEVLVMDWGIAKLRDESSGEPSSLGSSTDRSRFGSLDVDEFRTLSGAVMGTPAYMSPEQAEGAVDRIDERSDVYSLGAVLYEILTLAPPYTGRSMSEMVLQWTEGELEPPSARAPAARIPDELDAVVLKAMARRRGSRYQRVEDLQADVLAHLQGGMLGAMRYSTAQRVAKWMRRHRAATAALGVAALGLVTLLGVVWWGLDARRRALAEQEADLVRQKEEAVAREAERAEGSRRLAEFEALLGQVESVVTRGHREFLTEEVGGTVDRCVASYPEFARGHHVAARFRHRRFEFDLARPAYERAIRDATEQGQFRVADLARYHLAHLVLETDTGAAMPEEPVRLLAGIHPDDSPGPYRALESLLEYVRSGYEGSEAAYTRAVEACRRGLDEDPMFADLHYLRAVYECRETVLPLHVLERREDVLRLSMPYAPGPRQRAWAPAEASLRTCLSLDPGHERALRVLAVGLLMQGRTEEGVRQLAGLVGSFPDSPVLYLDLVNAHFMMAQVGEARRVLEDAIDRFPEDWIFHALLAGLYMRDGRYQDSLGIATGGLERMRRFGQHAERSVLYGPLSAMLLHSSRFYALVRLERFEEAEATWADFMGFLRRFAGKEGFQRIVRRFLGMPEPIRMLLGQSPPISYPSVLSRPGDEPERARAAVDAFARQVFRGAYSMEDLREGVFDPLEIQPYLAVCLYLASHDMYGRIDLVELKKRRFGPPTEFHPSLLTDVFYMLMVPYVARLYVADRVRFDDPGTPERMVGVLYLVGATDLALEVNRYLLERHSAMGSLHFQRAYILASTGGPVEPVAESLRVASALGYPLGPHRGAPVFERYLADPRIASAFGE